MDLSVIIPLFNEEENIDQLYGQIIQALEPMKMEFEVIWINDGSMDNSKNVLNELAVKDTRMKIIHFKKNFGQTAAIMAGINYSTGEILIPMDADMQNDPADIPMLLEKLNEGYDVCSGWRKHRQDNIKRRFPSKLANRLISVISGVKLHDYGCTLKAYRREVIEGIRLYGEMHRFIPIYATWEGAKVTEVVVNHHPRKFGKSKYGLNRTIKVLLDLMVVKFFSTYFQKPIYLAGTFALVCILISILTFGLMIWFKYWGGKTFVQTPLPIFSALFLIVGFLSFFLGLIAEMVMRTYHESQQKTTYLIGSMKNLEAR
jgi:glycosyltransferase involved in cell wall biosynthesis